MLKNKKAVEARELMITLAVSGVIAVVGLLIFSNVSNTSLDIFANTKKTQANESVTITCQSAVNNCDNSTLLSKSGYLSNTETLINDSTGRILVRNIDYKITLVGTSGDLSARANFTLLNISNETATKGGGDSVRGFNNTALDISYEFNDKSASRLTAEKTTDTTLDAFELGVIGLIVLAAVTILTVVYMLGRQ